MLGHHLATVRRAGRKRDAIFESSEALAEQRSRHCGAHSRGAACGCCARVSRCRGALLNQHIDGVARASSAGTKSGSSARSLVLHTMLAPVVENRTRLGDQLGLDDEANSKIGNRGRLPTPRGQLSSPWRSGVAVYTPLIISRLSPSLSPLLRELRSRRGYNKGVVFNRVF